LGKPPVNGDNTLNTLSSRMIARPYFGVAFTWIDRRDQFSAALASTASASGLVGSCVTSVTPDAVEFKEDGEGTITVDAGSDCTWIATLQNGGTQVRIEPGSGKGKATVKLHATAGAAPYSDTLNVVGPMGSPAKAAKLSQPAASCVTAPEATSKVDLAGKTEGDPVAIKASCAWTVTVEPANSPFKVTPTEGSGDGTLAIKAPAAGEADQTATVKIVGPAGAFPRVVTLTQPKKQ
jgi:hypothetical protein